MATAVDVDLYAVLSVSKSAKDTEARAARHARRPSRPSANICARLSARAAAARGAQIRRAYRNLITKLHPDKGGDAELFSAVQKAYDVLSNAAKRAQYDATGRLERTVDEELMDSFGGGARAACARARAARALAAT